MRSCLRCFSCPILFPSSLRHFLLDFPSVHRSAFNALSYLLQWVFYFLYLACCMLLVSSLLCPLMPVFQGFLSCSVDQRSWLAFLLFFLSFQIVLLPCLCWYRNGIVLPCHVFFFFSVASLCFSSYSVTLCPLFSEGLEKIFVKQ